MSTEIEKSTNASVTNTLVAVDVDTSTKEGKVKLYNILENAISLNDENITDFYCSGVVIKPGTRHDTVTDEIVDCMNVTFVTPDGKAYFSQSSGIVNSVRTILTIFGQPQEWGEEGLHFQVTEINLGRGKRLKKLECVL